MSDQKGRYQHGNHPVFQAMTEACCWVCTPDFPFSRTATLLAEVRRQRSALRQVRAGMSDDDVTDEEARAAMVAMSLLPCSRCGKNPADGWAFLNDERFCHGSNDDLADPTALTCYELSGVVRRGEQQ